MTLSIPLWSNPLTPCHVIPASIVDREQLIAIVRGQNSWLMINISWCASGPTSGSVPVHNIICIYNMQCEFWTALHELLSLSLWVFQMHFSIRYRRKILSCAVCEDWTSQKVSVEWFVRAVFVKSPSICPFWVNSKHQINYKWHKYRHETMLTCKL